MKSELLSHIVKAAVLAGITDPKPILEYPDGVDHGDFSTNIAFVHAKNLGLNPRALADKIVEAFDANKPDFIEKVTIAGPGFINFFCTAEYFARTIVDAAGLKNYGTSDLDHGKKIMVEYTDPNPFKEFHIGHLMSNAVGESISRLIESTGAKVIRANWQGDVGPHVAKAVWGALNSDVKPESGENAARFWGRAYAAGEAAYTTTAEAKKSIEEINRKIYDKSDAAINTIYEKGRRESLEHFEDLYKRLDTHFDHYFFEGTEGRGGEAVVREFLKKGIFKESEGAIIFPGEKHCLHTRVFITSHGLPTYETKEIGLNVEKFKLHPDLDESIIVTANEQNDYFKVILKVFSLIAPKIAEKTRHVSHGLLRFASGKMSSRTGSVIAATSLIDDVKALVVEKMKGREISAETGDTIADAVAIAAIKYSILRQAPGSDVIFDTAASISFEGDSGPYLQYSARRAHSILEKAGAEGIEVLTKIDEKLLPKDISLVERLVSRFPDIVLRARLEYAPQHIATYLINVAGAFNAFYASQMIVDSKDSLSPYYVTLTQAFLSTMTQGLHILGVQVPEKM